MKKIINKKISSFLALAIIVVFSLSVSFAMAANPGEPINALIHRGAGEQAIKLFKVGDETSLLSGVAFDARSTLSNVYSRFSGGPDSFFLTLGTASLNNININVIKDVLPDQWVNQTAGISPQLQKVNVNGNVLSTSLANAGGDSVCVDGYGRIKLCTSTPTNGVCDNTTNNACTAGTLSDTADSSTNYLWSCLGIDGGTDDSCSLAIPATPVNGVCDNTTNNACSSGTLSDTADSSTNYLWSCLGIDGGTDDSCSLAIPTGPSVILVYDEGIEWPFVSYQGTVQSTLDKYTGTYSINGPAKLSTDYPSRVKFKSLTETINESNLDSISFWMKLNESISTNYVFFELYSNGTQVGQKLFKDGTYGLDAYSTAWQKITVPKADMGLTAGVSFNEVVMFPWVYQVDFAGYYIDNVQANML